MNDCQQIGKQIIGYDYTNTLPVNDGDVIERRFYKIHFRQSIS